MSPATASPKAYTDALERALGRIVAEARQDLATVREQSAAVVAAANARVAEAEARLLGLDAQICARLADLRDGLPGERGEQGLPGERGEQGEPGERGLQGERGEQGPHGERGERGEQGEPGERGLQGDRGEQGLPGERGERGEPGERGLQGDRGEQGPQGERGEQGETGERGLQGERGEQGPQGERGEQGETGERGLQGDRGEQGRQGERGENGHDVSDITVEQNGAIIEFGFSVGHERSIFEIELPAGPRGEPGQKGERGDTGATGKMPVAQAWSDCVHYEGEVRSHAGATWQARRDTAKEPPHEDWICLAERGADGRGYRLRGLFSPDTLNYRELDVVVLNGASFVAVRDGPGPCPGDGWQLQAQQGKRGAPGERGPKGDRGEPGPAGDPVLALTIEDEATLTLINGDGSKVELDLYPLLRRIIGGTSS